MADIELSTAHITEQTVTPTSSTAPPTNFVIGTTQYRATISGVDKAWVYMGGDGPSSYVWKEIQLIDTGPTTIEGNENTTALPEPPVGEWALRLDASGNIHTRVNGGSEVQIGSGGSSFVRVARGAVTDGGTNSLTKHDITFPDNADVSEWEFDVAFFTNGTGPVVIQVAEDNGSGGLVWLETDEYDNTKFYSNNGMAAPVINNVPTNSQSHIPGQINGGSGSPLFVKGHVENRRTAGQCELVFTEYYASLDDVTVVTSSITLTNKIRGIRFAPRDAHINASSEWLETLIFNVWGI